MPFNTAAEFSIGPGPDSASLPVPSFKFPFNPFKAIPLLVIKRGIFCYNPWIPLQGLQVSYLTMSPRAISELLLATSALPEVEDEYGTSDLMDSVHEEVQSPKPKDTISILDAVQHVA